jgi:AcrR family transcriptional regulator
LAQRAEQRRHRLESVARPKQARSEQTLFRLLDAAEALIDEKSLADASIPEIVRRAGSSVGGFYARFKDKNELLRALEERFFEQVSERLEELADPGQWGDAPIPEIVAACVHELVRITRERRSLIQAFLYRSAVDVEFREDGLRFRRKVSAHMTELLLTRRDQIRHPDPPLGIDFGVQLAFGLMLQSVVLGDLWAGGRRLSSAELERELARSFLTHIGVPVDDRGARAIPAPAEGERRS